MGMPVKAKVLERTIKDLYRREDRVLSELHPALRDKTIQLLEMFDGALAPYEGFRDKANQESRKANGHSRAGWLQSPHNYKPACATDLVLNPRIVPVDSVYDQGTGEWYPNLWDYETPEAVKVYDELHKAAKAIGLERVYLGKKLDHPHIQLPEWPSIVKHYV